MDENILLMLIGDYVEDYKVMVSFQVLQTGVYIPFIDCPNNKAGEVIHTSIHDFEGDQTYSEKRRHNITLNGIFDEVDENNFDALVIHLGRSPKFRV